MPRRGGAAVARGRLSPALAQAVLPERPITLVVPFGPGGIADLTARTVAQAMSASLKQPIVVDNKPSAGSIVGSTAVAQAAPDGYTLLLMSNANAVSASLFKKLPFDVTQAFAPVGLLGVFDLALFVNADSRFKSLAELLADAKARPGKLSIGTIAVGSTQHLSAELFKTRTGIDALIVPYKGTPAVLTALRAGEIDAAFEILGPMLPQVQAKAIRALAVTSDKRFSALPDVPTMGQAGVRQLQRGLVERIGRAGEDAAGGDRPAQRGRQRGAEVTRRAGAAARPGRAPARRHAAADAGTSGGRDRALARSHPRREDRAGMRPAPRSPSRRPYRPLVWT